jgi:CCR4-NOT transcription complex subunit 6
VLSYNILADAYTNPLHYPHTDSRVLFDFEYRANRVIMELEESAADIICLQEVDHFDSFYKTKLESLGYQCDLVYRRETDAELIGWKSKTFALIAKQNINHEDLVPRYGEFGSHFKRGNVGLICLLEHIETKSKLIVVNTHIHWNTKYDYVKYAQGFWLLKCLSSFLQEQELDMEKTPVIICGDFNSKPNSSIYHLMNNKSYDLSIKDRSHPEKGVKAYRKK